MFKTRATVTDKGLSRRLGEEIILVKKGKRGDLRGSLVFYPDRYAITLSTDEKPETQPIEKGDAVGLRIGSGRARYSPHIRYHVYAGR